MNKKKLRDAVKLILEAAGEDASREGLKKTPERVAEMYEELLGGYSVKSPEKILSAVYKNEKYSEIILVKDIPFYSLCEHHILPFFGIAHVAYIPKDRALLGLSKIPRLVDAFARRLQIQERLTQQIADTINSSLKPLGVMVIIEAEHLCMTMRGVKKPGTRMTTSALRGIFMKDAKVRAEAMTLIKNG
ncbi:GTP cyclohydrolase I FolE [bacterium]|nr:GTP cyclohydrolase I FolE [bacterium]MBU3954892.1 GTP cyclohydrolase I FolE [bacterium]MBU4134591.1 GTP cyclohydrolase I FolE [bacterium]